LLKKGSTLEQSLLIKKLVEEMYVLMKSPSFKPMELAYPMMEQWALKKQLSSMMTTEAVVDIENKVKDVCPQAGLRLIGSGGRGCMLVLAPPDYQKPIVDRLQGYVCSPFSIDWEGCKVRKGNGY
jgi:galactokinase/mevalonate kinase-like predicted kinase